MKHLIPILIIGVLLFLLRGVVLSINSVVKNQHTIRDLQTELQDKQKDNLFLNQRLQYVQKNEFVENEARERLGMVRGGEVIVLLPSPQASKSQPITYEDKRPNWKKWWDVFF